MLARITGKSIPQETRSASTSLNIIKKNKDVSTQVVGVYPKAGPGKYSFPDTESTITNG